jgi:2-oxo-4-hydroxy-4-carboxy-5-ureidoimidazoline decarboxylase
MNATPPPDPSAAPASPAAVPVGLATAQAPSDWLAWLNALPAQAAETELLACCAAPAWAAAMAVGRPYPDLDAVLETSDIAVAALSEADLAAALAGHPRIGDRQAGDRSRREQAGVLVADEDTIADLARGNAEYEDRFGHIYLVCAAGRSGAELLAVLRDRLGNDPAAEWRVVRTELAKINQLRLGALLDPAAPPPARPAPDATDAG